jgi:hypothetical protein
MRHVRLTREVTSSQSGSVALHSSIAAMLYLLVRIKALLALQQHCKLLPRAITMWPYGNMASLCCLFVGVLPTLAETITIACVYR